jgi:hypothetical protein
MDKLLLAVVALGFGFFLWQMEKELHDIKDTNTELAWKIDEMKVKPPATIPEPHQEPVQLAQPSHDLTMAEICDWLRKHGYTMHVMLDGKVNLKKKLAPPLNLKPILTK